MLVLGEGRGDGVGGGGVDGRSMSYPPGDNVDMQRLCCKVPNFDSTIAWWKGGEEGGGAWCLY